MKKYILKSDLELPVEERTIWHLNEITAATIFENFKKHYDGEELKSDVIDDWLASVNQIENFDFSSSNPFGYAAAETLLPATIDVRWQGLAR